MQARLRTLEAMVFVTIARVLIRLVPLAKWRGALGEQLDGNKPGDLSGNHASHGARTKACVSAINRATIRLPGTICLPQAIALQWMLRRRRIPSTITLGVLPANQRGSRDSLHAWVEVDGIAVLGDTAGRHISLLRFRTKF